MAKVAAELKYSAENDWISTDCSGPSVVSGFAFDYVSLCYLDYVDLLDGGSPVTEAETCGAFVTTNLCCQQYSLLMAQDKEVITVTHC